MTLLFVRELTSEGDVILAFASDGSPVWALDRDSGLQWWYADGARSEAQRDIEQHWASFDSMPITAASYAGPHPAVELGRLADRRGAADPVPAPPVEHPLMPALRGAASRFAGLPRAGQALVVAGAVVLAFVLLSWLLAPLAAPEIPRAPAAGPPAADAPCEVRGEAVTLADGTVLVCAPLSRALSSQLVWRSTT